MAVLSILAVLFIALLVVVPMLEKSSMRISKETQAKFAKWAFPLIIIILVIQLFMYY
ncbi:MAG: hypothetical protein ACI97K_002503 [Glaciecola sp.]|jgi:hypothetical protein